NIPPNVSPHKNCIIFISTSDSSKRVSGNFPDKLPEGCRTDVWQSKGVACWYCVSLCTILYTSLPAEERQTLIVRPSFLCVILPALSGGFPAGYTGCRYNHS